MIDFESLSLWNVARCKRNSDLPVMADRRCRAEQNWLESAAKNTTGRNNVPACWDCCSKGKQKLTSWRLA